MARIDSILSIVLQQGANELRVGTGREPKMLAHGVPKRLSIPSTPEDTLRELLGDILSPERERTMREKGRVEVAYEAGGLGAFHVTIAVRDGGGFDAAFVKGGARPPKAPAPAEASAVPAVRDDRAAEGVRAPAEPPGPAPLTSHGAGAAPPSATTNPGGVPVQVAPGQFAPSSLSATLRAAEVTAQSAETLARLVARAVAMRASDLHFADGEPPTVRVDGALQRLDDEAELDVAKTIPMGAALERVSLGGSIDLGLEFAGVGRVRVHVYRAEEGLAAAVRLLPRNAPSLASLHMPVPLDGIVNLPHGLVLVCGATGSGKSTTLAALAQEAISRKSIVLTTLEDPIEYTLTASTSLVRRRQVGRDVPDFATGLRDSLREDPDLLLVGEMRDPETIGLALTAAETGHLVLASMHSRSTASAIERIVDAYPPERQDQIRVQLADSLRVVVAQRLVRRARGGGRLPVIEVLRVTHAVASMIREGKTAQIATALQSGKREGMLALERCLADRVQAGDLRAEDARAVSNDPASLAMYLGERVP